jgi:hypothetical protein
MTSRISMLALVLAAVAAIGSARPGYLKLDVLGEVGAGARNQAEVMAPGGKVVAKVAPGATVALAPGIYRLKLPIVGGEITRDDVAVEAGRTHTVLIRNVAVLTVAVKDAAGKDPGFNVTVTSADPPHARLATFLSGDKVLFAPAAVDVTVDAPPQGYSWNAIALVPGQRARLTLSAVVPGELVVEPVWSKIALDKSTRVIVYHAGTQRQVAASPPAPEHRFKLDPGDYDVYVENSSGKGLPYATATGIRVAPGATVKRVVPLDEVK